MIEPTTRFRGVRGLVVEHSWHVADAMRSRLQSLGVAVQGMAGRFEDADRLLLEQTFDLALVGINLKDEKAYELMRRLDQRGVRVIVSGQSVAQASFLHTFAFLQKPIIERELLAALIKVSSC
jgi:DNA-binding response OmpR family regulator